eukprot:4733-Amphidinium_carterae.1
MSDLRVRLSRLHCGSVRDVCASDSVGDYNATILDLRGLSQGEVEVDDREEMEHLIMRWGDSVWQNQLAEKYVPAGKIVHVVVDTQEACIVTERFGKEISAVTGECGQLDVIHVKQDKTNIIGALDEMCRMDMDNDVAVQLYEPASSDSQNTNVSDSVSAEFQELESAVQDLSWPVTQRGKLKGKGVRSLVYGAYTKQGCGIIIV